MGVNFRYVVIAGLILSMLVTAGCVESYIDAQIAGDDVPGEISLNDTEEDQEPEGCQIGYKQCGKACIKEEDCCDDKDCDIGEDCVKFECVSLKPAYCPYLMEWGVYEGKCVCEEGTRWCDYQDKCIPEIKCCSRFDCSRRDAEYCAPSYVSLRVCVENGEKSCKFISELKNQKNFAVGADNVLVSFDGYVEGGIVDFTINDNTFLNVAKAQRINMENITVFFDEFKELGGTCQDYD